MIVLGYIEIHPKICIWKIIVKELRVLLILHFYTIGGEIRCPCTKCKNKKFHQLDVVILMHL